MIECTRETYKAAIRSGSWGIGLGPLRPQPVTVAPDLSCPQPHYRFLLALLTMAGWMHWKKTAVRFGTRSMLTAILGTSSIYVAAEISYKTCLLRKMRERADHAGFVWDNENMV